MPILGRSVCYRMALPAPLVLGEWVGYTPLPPGQARRALAVMWRYFIANGGVEGGRVTQGYCGADLRFLDEYSGQGSCLWSLRSLVTALAHPPDAPFWRTPERALPIEEGGYSLRIPEPGWSVVGRAADQEVTIIQESAKTAATPPPRDYGTVARMLDAMAAAYGLTRELGGPWRPMNRGLGYSAPRYSSREPFCGCAPPAR